MESSPNKPKKSLNNRSPYSKIKTMQPSNIEEKGKTKHESIEYKKSRTMDGTGNNKGEKITLKRKVTFQESIDLKDIESFKTYNRELTFEPNLMNHDDIGEKVCWNCIIY